MRAAAVDGRLISPPASQWMLTGGAYLDGDDIVLPAVGALADVWVPTTGVAAITVSTMLWVPSGGSNRWSLAVHPGDAARSISSGSWSYHGWAPGTDQWGRATALAQSVAGSVWTRIRIGIPATPSYGVPGTRFRPGPDDWVITH